MKVKLIIILLCSTLSTYAQNLTKQDFDKAIKPLSDKAISLQVENGRLKDGIRTLNSKLSNTTLRLDSLQKRTEAISKAFNKTSEDLGLKISTSETNANRKISEVDQSLSKTSLYGIIGVLLAILLSGLFYWLVRKRLRSDKSDLIEQLSKTKSSIEDSLIKEFGRQTELMETQLRLIEQQKTANQTKQNIGPDHSLALKVADQLVAIERSVGLMDQKTKGLQRIKNSITNLKDNLSANGYELPDLIGKPFNQGMKIIVVSSIPDENLKIGEEIISRVVKPQVNYNDKMIQAAQVEVSVGY